MNTGGPAFPTLADNGHSTNQDGMTLRDYFAAKAMQGLLTIPAEELSKNKTHKHERLDSYVAYLSYTMANAMLKEREQ